MAVFVYDASSLIEDLFQGRLDDMLACKDHIENFARSIEVNLKQLPDISHRLSKVKAPTLIIWSLDDRFVLLDVGLRFL